MEFRKSWIYLIIVIILFFIALYIISNSMNQVKENEKISSSTGEVMVTVVPSNNATGEVSVEVGNREVN